MPEAMLVWLSAPSVPDSYFGEYYLSSKGTIALYNPTHIPCINLTAKNKYKFGKSTRIPLINANTLTASIEFLHICRSTFSKTLV